MVRRLKLRDGSESCLIHNNNVSNADEMEGRWKAW